MCDSILPFYLKNIAYDITQKREKISFKTECTCGCRLFDFYKKKVTTEERKRKKGKRTAVCVKPWHTNHDQSRWSDCQRIWQICPATECKILCSSSAQELRNPAL